MVKYRFKEIILKIVKTILLLLALIGLLYLCSCTNFCDVVKYRTVFYTKRELFVECKNELLADNTIDVIYFNNKHDIKYDKYKKLGAEIIVRWDERIYFQLWSNRKFGRGIVYTESENLEKNSSIDWLYQIDEGWYICQEH